MKEQSKLKAIQKPLFLLICTLVLIMAAGSTRVSAAIPTPYINRWQLEGNLMDSMTGNSLDGYYTTDIYSVTEGSFYSNNAKEGTKSLAFNASGTPIGYSGKNKLSINQVGSSYSISMLVYLDSAYFSSTQFLMSLTDSSCGSYVDLVLNASGSGSVTLSYNGESTTGAISADTWHNIVIVREGQTLRLYVDGSPSSLSCTTTLFQPANLFLGPTESGYALRGYMDDIIAYDKVLSATETLALSNYYSTATPTDITLSNLSTAESTSNTTVGTLGTADADTSDTFTYSLVSGTGSGDNGLFTISGNSLILTSSDYETKNSLSVRIRTTDGCGHTYDKAFTITVTNVNEAPTNITLSSSTVTEGTTAVGTLSATDPEGDTYTYSLVTGTGDTDNGSFSITGNSLTLKAAAPDYEAGAKTYNVRIQASDSGGTYSEAFTITLENANEAPTDISLSPSAISENSASGDEIGTLTASDPDAGDSFTYTLASGTGADDNGSFTISSDKLKLNMVPDYETKSSYSIRVKVTDAGVPGRSFEKVFTITITDGNDAPTDITLTGGSVAENAASGTSAGTLSSTDPNGDTTFTYTLVAGTGDTDNASFSITDNSLKLMLSANYENKSSYSVRIRSTDPFGLAYEEAFTVSISNVNEEPTDVAIATASIAENSASGTVIGSLSALDPDTGDTFTYIIPILVGDNSCFSITGNSLKLAIIPDYEVKSSYSIIIRATDAGGLYVEKAVTISITDGNDAPTNITLSNMSVPEHSGASYSVGTLGTTDQDAGDSFTYSLVSGDTSAFEIVSTNQLRTKADLDYEVKSSYSVVIQTTDNAGATFQKTFTIAVTDGNDPPTDITVTPAGVAENTTTGSVVGTLSSTSTVAGNTFAYSLVSGTGSTDNALFSITSDSLILNEVPNYEAKSSYSVRIHTLDAYGFTCEKAITITVTDVNETPTDISLTASTVSENASVGTVIGTLSGSDPDAGETLSYSLVTGTGDTDNAAFTISSNSLLLQTTLDYETKTSYSIRVGISDGEYTYEKVFTITVVDGNDAPTDIAVSSGSVAENTASGSTIATLSSTDPNTGNTFTYTLVNGTGSTDNSSFTISGSSLKLAITPDYETKSSYQIRIRTTDNGSLYCEKAFVITITDANEAPVDVNLSNTSVTENSSIGTQIASLSATDPDSTATFMYTLVSGTGSTDNAFFTVSGSQLLTASAFDYEANSSYSIRIRVTDQGTLYYEKVFTISVTDVNETPTDLSLSNSTVAENTASGTAIGTLSTTDADAGNTYTYSLISGSGDTDNASFTITGSTLKLAVVPNYETKSSYSIRIRVNDGANNYEESFTVTVTDAEEAPNNINLSFTDVAEQTPIGTTVAAISAADQDAAETFAYALVSGTGDTDNASFTISSNELKLAVVPDRETKSSYSIRIRVTDSASLSYEKVFTITVSNVNEAPTEISISQASVAENTSAGTTVGTLATTDVDPGDTFTYTLVSGTGDTDNFGFTISGNRLKLTVVPDYETKSSYSIRVRATDSGSLYYEKAFTITITDVNENVAVNPPVVIPTPSPTPTATPTPSPTSVPSPTQSPVVEKITSEVTNGESNTSVTRIEVTRTTEADGTIKDSIALNEADTQETIARLLEDKSDTARIILPDTVEAVSESNIAIATGALSLLSESDINLELETQNARISIPNDSLKTAATDLEEDLYFNVIPVDGEKKQEDVIGNAKSNSMVLELMQGDGFGLVGTPMEIETNIPSTAVDIVLPLKGIIIPTDEKERKAFLDSLAVYVEHSDGEKEVIRGELVEYSKGVYGLKFTVTKFSTFTIIVDEEYLNKADECNLIKLNGVKVSSKKVTINCDYDVTSIKFKSSISKGAAWTLYSDKACTKVIKNNKKSLKVGKNVVYIKVTSYDGEHSKVYKVTVVRKDKSSK